jgi:hypothetical protein
MMTWPGAASCALISGAVNLLISVLAKHQHTSLMRSLEASGRLFVDPWISRTGEAFSGGAPNE